MHKTFSIFSVSNSFKVFQGSFKILGFKEDWVEDFFGKCSVSGPPVLHFKKKDDLWLQDVDHAQKLMVLVKEPE